MQKTFQDLLDYIASRIEYAKDELETDLDKEEEPSRLTWTVLLEYMNH
jgi:hypothetical protein